MHAGIIYSLQIGRAMLGDHRLGSRLFSPQLPRVRTRFRAISLA